MNTSVLRYYLEKGTGPRPWRVVDSQGSPARPYVRLYQTKKLASALVDALNGNNFSAKLWYSLELEKYKKLVASQRLPIEVAIRYAAFDAYILGFLPSQVGVTSELEFNVWPKNQRYN